MRSFRRIAFLGLDTLSSFTLMSRSNTSWEMCSPSFLRTWVRYYGPPRQVHSDQGGNFHSGEFAEFCDKLLIKRVPGGSETAKPGKHSLTGAIEKHIDLLKGTMSKAFADLTDSDHTVDVVMLMHESCMAHSTLLCYQDVSPICGVLGQAPRDLTDMCNETTSSLATSDPADLLERSILYRQHARASSLRAVAETRIARAQHAIPKALTSTWSQSAAMLTFTENRLSKIPPVGVVRAWSWTFRKRQAQPS